MSNEIRDRARKLFRAPFKYEGGYIWDDDGEMLADKRGEASGSGATLRVRGWGRLGHIAKSPGEAAALQDAYGELIAEALTAHFGKTPAPVIPSRAGGEAVKSDQDQPASSRSGNYAMFCEHANEVPQACPCAPDCYCKDHTCRYREAP